LLADTGVERDILAGIAAEQLFGADAKCIFQLHILLVDAELLLPVVGVRDSVYVLADTVDA